jgi:hypothetical protein
LGFRVGTTRLLPQRLISAEQAEARQPKPEARSAKHNPAALDRMFIVS